ncbi:hypothetical protein BKP35_03600 [Anaerobacillus arseniciselenatis]|uniref:Uncharacterized protein n=1 Tax=Anaerobacillus arseniciselenatis TaxID=85682 RepID=A0A1S2LUQ1_9BACI|nr:hypothetical protein [Anaerobacillus arseniciselenatis]OIJ16076.1 hypothetical protein BKP35_03600 [Anaerobacillus arseniciselenatis]
MNKVVFLLPLSAMFMLFYFGYLYISSDEVITNKSLQNEIIIDLNAESTEDEVVLKGEWDWTTMPVDGVVGNDYIVISLQSDEGALFNTGNITSSSMSLLKGENVLDTLEAQIFEDEVIFVFPNKVIEHESYGNRGEVELVIQLEEHEEFVVAFSYIHTWVEHDHLLIEEAQSFEKVVAEKLDSSYWVVKRFLTL